MSASRVPASGAGFTLLEMLVVLAILGLLGSLVAGSLFAAAQAWHGVVRHGAEADDLAAARALLRRSLSQIQPEPTGDLAHRMVRFSGDATGVAYLAPLPQRFGAEDIAQHTLQFAPDGTLRLGWRLDRRSAVASLFPAPGGTETILDEIVNGSFSYYGPAARDEEPRWWSAWKERPWLPSLIRVRFTRHGRAEELIVAPLVTGAFCQPGALDAACQE